ncbi:Beta-catenin-like protein 1 [Microtus ochrogaster]|uniref:Beta-catenin-like protein 1 n=1 Tax=Microtus ochrogaster TaxID=79684 RepID=A0A8J6KZ19_MICOH|nr:Beta-catenin-like protein 1 [Microtus ochrogaster]
MAERLPCAVEIVTAMEKPVSHAWGLPVVERCAWGLPVVERSLSALTVVDLLQELTDIDTLHESEEGAEVLIDALVDGQVVALLVQNLERLDESVREEADGVHNTLAIVENMAEFRPEMCTEAAQQGLLQWLLKRLKAKMPFDANKLYCSEVLAILLQDNDENRELLGELDGIDVLLQQLSVFKRHNPSTAEEQEMMENLFDALCSCLMLSSNRERFLKGEGLQLMNLMLREKKISRSSALKVLDHAMIGPEGTDNCHKFVDILGLRTIFPLFMKSPRKIKKVGTTEKEHEGMFVTSAFSGFTVPLPLLQYFTLIDVLAVSSSSFPSLVGRIEHVCSILASLLRNLRGQQRTRLLNKFTENDSEKVDRLMELHFKYLGAMQVADKKIEGEKHDIVRRGEIIDNDMEDEFYLRRLDAGLFILQHICYIMAEICNANVPQIRQRVHQILNMRGSSIKIVRHIIKEYAENIGDGRSPEFRETEQKRILGLLENF